MNFISTGIHEIGRRYRRAADCRQLSQEQHLLDGAEISLGQLGWEQVDFPASVEKQIQAIKQVELKQTEFSNRSAGIQGNIDQLQAQREQNKQEHAHLLSAIQAELQPLLKSRDQLKKPIAGLEKGAGRFERAIADLDQKIASVSTPLPELKAIRPQTLLIQQQIIKIEDERIEYETQKEGLQRARRKIIEEIKAAAFEIDALDAQITEQNQKIAAAGDEFSAREKESLVMISSLEHDKGESKKTIDNLDQNKAAAYLAIGRCLADFNIPPRYQPEALKTVLDLRKVVRGRQERIAESTMESSKTSRVAMAAFYTLLFLVFAAVIAMGVAVSGVGHRHASSKPPGSNALFPRAERLEACRDRVVIPVGEVADIPSSRKSA